MKYQAFFIIFEGLSLKQIYVYIFLEDEIPTLNSHFTIFLQYENYSKT